MSFDDFYHSNYWKAYGYFVRKGVPHHDAEELTQEAFLYCYNHYSDYDPRRSAIATWLYVIVASRFKNYCRDRRLSTDLDSIAEIVDESSAVDRAVELEEMRSILASALKALPDIQRKIVIMRYFSGDTTEDVARKLNISTGNARVLLSRALKEIRMISSVGERSIIDG